MKNEKKKKKMKKKQSFVLKYLQEKYLIEPKIIKLLTEVVYSDEELVQTLPPKPEEKTEEIRRILKNEKIYPTNIHRYEKPVYCFSILGGSQFYLNEKFSNNVSFSQSNNNYQNLYLSYKKSTIIRKLNEMTKHLQWKCSLTETSIPGLVIDMDDYFIQLSIWNLLSKTMYIQ